MIRTYNYACIPSECKVDFIHITKDESEKDTEELCPECGQPMKKMGEIAHFIGAFSSQSPERKKEILTKRARDHEKRDKEIKARKEAYEHGELT